jgi:hypothetical protein
VDLILFGLVLAISDLDLSHKYPGFVFGTLIEFAVLLFNLLDINFDNDLFGGGPAHQCLKVHQSIAHILVLGLEQTLHLVEG